MLARAHLITKEFYQYNLPIVAEEFHEATSKEMHGFFRSAEFLLHGVQLVSINDAEAVLSGSSRDDRASSFVYVQG